MTRVLLTLWLLIRAAGLAHAQAVSVPGGTLDLELLSSVQAEAIDFMVPRTLEPVTPSDLALWALTGLTAIDPALTILSREGGKLSLAARGKVLAEATVSPSDPRPAKAWADAIAKMTAAAYADSQRVRQAGQTDITQRLFDDMLGHLDAYSRYIPPRDALGDRDRRSGRAGLGMTLAPGGRVMVVRDVVIGGPASMAGLGIGDVILTIDDERIIGWGRGRVDAALNGPEGTDVHIEWRDPDGGGHAATLTRSMVPPETVFMVQNNEIAFLRITGFSQNTDQHVALMIRSWRRGRRAPAGLVIDLRGNRGGVLRTAIATADLFVTGGVLARSSGRAADTNRVWVSRGQDQASGLPIVILVDGGTASAAEVLAAALADRGRAVVIGSSTFGKGVVQTIDSLPDGGELFLTWARLLAPLGWPIQSLGVLPQICTSFGKDATDQQLAALAAGHARMAGALARHRAARAPMTPDQIVAIRGACPASDPREDDVRVARAVLEDPTRYATAVLRDAGPDH